MTKIEYWCCEKEHWATEVKLPGSEPRLPNLKIPICRRCWEDARNWEGLEVSAATEAFWERAESATRKAKKPRYVQGVDDKGKFGVWDESNLAYIDTQLTRVQAKEMAAIRNKWDEIGEA